LGWERWEERGEGVCEGVGRVGRVEWEWVGGEREDVSVMREKGIRCAEPAQFI